MTRPGFGLSSFTDDDAGDQRPDERDDRAPAAPLSFGLGVLALADRATREDAPTLDEPPAPPKVDANDLVALAAVLHSEASAPRYTDDERYAIGRAVMNRARRKRKSVYDLLAPLGREQLGANPPFSTARAGDQRDLALAERLLRDSDAPDPTHGAGAFFEPAVQDDLKRRGDLYRSDPVRYASNRRWAKYHKSADQIRASWGPMLARVGRFEFYR